MADSMKQLLNSARKTIVYYWLAIVYAFLFSVNSLALAVIASLMNAEWSNLSASSKFMVVIVITANWTGTMLAFVNKTIHRLQVGKELIETGDTETFSKVTTQVETATKAKV